MLVLFLAWFMRMRSQPYPCVQENWAKLCSDLNTPMGLADVYQHVEGSLRRNPNLQAHGADTQTQAATVRSRIPPHTGVRLILIIIQITITTIIAAVVQIAAEDVDSSVLPMLLGECLS